VVKPPPEQQGYRIRLGQGLRDYLENPRLQKQSYHRSRAGIVFLIFFFTVTGTIADGCFRQVFDAPFPSTDVQSGA
jgi:hypothetical protein